jgi:hypothetical protein
MSTFILTNPYRASTTGLVSADLDDYVINPMHEHGDMLYGGTAGSTTRLVGNTTTDCKFLSQLGTGVIAGDPSWIIPTSANISYDGDEATVHDKLDALGTAIGVVSSTQGTSGIQGYYGVQGVQGNIGIQGASGINGINGTNGINGVGISVQGIAGSMGLQGVVGIGLQGPTGDGSQGPAGGNGTNGSVGPGVCFQGYFDPARLYYNNANRRDIVRYENDYYLYKGEDAHASAWDEATNWEHFGATFNSVATEILFAAFGYVDNLGVRELEAVGRTVGTLNGTLATEAPDHVDNAPGVFQVETITLTGEEGFAWINIGGTLVEGAFVGGVTQHCLWNETLTKTATDFASEHGYANLQLSSNGPKIIFTALVAGVGFTQPAIINVPETHRGAVKIQGNDIWENVKEDGESGGIYINRRSYDGGQGYHRYLTIQDGMGGTIATFAGNIKSGETDLGSGFAIFTPLIYVPMLPNSSVGLISGQLYSDGGFIKVKL